MPLIYLSENNSLSKKALKLPFSGKDVSVFELPFKKMRKRAIANFRERLISTDALFLSSPRLSSLIPERNADTKAFFDSVIISTLCSVIKRKNILYDRLVIINPTEEIVLSAIDNFPELALSGDNALLISSRIYEAAGVSIPIVSGYDFKNIVLCMTKVPLSTCTFAAGHDIEAGENSLSGQSLKFYPDGKYSPIVSLLKRPLTLKEASLLAEYDKKATIKTVF